MKRVICMSIAALSFLLGACDGGTAGDPSTAAPEDLNPPSALITVTGDKKVELRFNTANAEGEDFKGYHVFAIKKAISELPAPAYPAGMTVEKLRTTFVPRCALNTALFEAFKFTPDTRDCEGDTDTDEGADAGTTDDAMMMQGDDAAEDPAAEKLTNMVICEGNTDTTISLPATSPSLGQQTCVVTKDSEGNALENGATYTFFVVSVLGDDKSDISWTSNFVEDTPALPVYNKADFKVAVGKSYFIPADKLSALAAIADADITSDDCIPEICTIYKINNSDVATADGIYLGRFGGTNPTRMFISTPTGSAITIELRGNQTIDPKDGSFQTSIPGDEATASETYFDGTHYAVYGPVVYDIKWTKDASTVHYGKIVFGQPTVDEAVADGLGEITMPITIIMQPDANNRHYFN